MLDEIRVISIFELRREASADLEYDHPDRDLMARSPHAVTYGFKPVIDGKFFDSDEDAVEYLFQTDPMYSQVKDLDVNIQVLECFDEENDTLHYSLYKGDESLHLSQNIFSQRLKADTPYRFIFEKESLTLMNEENGVQMTCTLQDDNACEWNESFDKLFGSEMVLYPSNIDVMFEHLWLSWSENEIDNEALETELASLVQWINGMTRTKPISQFWNNYC